ncbi:MAG: SLC13/DASS family transporter [Acidobacteria bacterium]|nr:SLC13/DASS family transporter [Acidobacteriota bacterium]
MDVVLLVLVLAFLLVSFVLEKLPVDVTALIALGLLLLFGLITPEQATAGFSNPAVVTVMMMFILSEGLVQSGVVRRIGYGLVRLAGRQGQRATRGLLGLAGLISAFVNNTAAVAIFIPVTLDLAKHYRISPSRLLIPLSYVTILGGTCTLIGTSTNVLVSSLATQHGLAPFSMFEFLAVGGVVFVVGSAYNLWLVPRLIPVRATQASLTGKYRMDAYLTELRVRRGSVLIGRTVLEEELSERFRVNLLEVVRAGRRIASDLRNLPLEVDDVLLVRGSMEDILAFKEQRGLLLLTDVKLGDKELSDETTVLVEVQVRPSSTLVGSTLKEIDFRKRYACFVLALARTGEVLREKISSVPLRPWDTLLVFGPRQRVDGLAQAGDFVPLQEVHAHLHRSRRWWIGALAIPLVVALAATGLMPILKSAILGVVLLLATRTLRIQQAYRAIDWTVIFVLASVLPLGAAMEQTGLAAGLAGAIVRVGEPYGPWAMLSLVILATSLLTEFITNNSAAVLMVPIAFSIAEHLGVDAKPFLMGLTFAASMSFATPTGYQTNTMVYGPGGYRFVDYVKAGAPLNLILWLLTSFLVPWVWPF